MTIVSHVIEKGAVQKDGYLAIVERYIRDDGSEAMYVTHVDPGADLAAHAARRIDEIETADANVVEPDPVVTKLDDVKSRYMRGDVSGAKTAVSEVAQLIHGKP